MRPIWGTLDPFYEAGEVLGRKVANSEFLRSLLQADAFQEYHFFLPDRTRADRLSALLRERHPDLVDGGRMRIFLRRELPRALSQREYACFHLSDCINHPGHLARLRNAVSKSLFPITSVTHSLSYSRYVVDFLTQLWPGTTDRDCIVATSQAGKQVVESYFSLLRNNLNLDGDSFSAPSVEQIPLGVDTGSWSPPDLSGKNRIRREFGLNEGDVAVLVFGRISPDSKMDLLPLLRALQRVKEGSHPPQVALILSGWLEKNEQYGRHLAGLAANLNLSFRLFPRPSDEFKKKVFQASDIFVSIADNPQETFGLTVLEAMAAGLPVVASDYDGYRAMVRHEENGFLIPTLGPAATESLDMLAPLCGDRQAHLLLGQQTVVSVPCLARRISQLARDGRLRERLGREGRRVAERDFAWPKIVRRYLRLWEDLADKPVDRDGTRGKRHPLHLPYSRIFQSYPSGVFKESTRLVWTRTGRAVYREQEHPLLYPGLEEFLRIDRLRPLLFVFRSPRPLGEGLFRLCDPDRSLDREEMVRTVQWALKQDFLEVVE